MWTVCCNEEGFSFLDCTYKIEKLPNGIIYYLKKIFDLFYKISLFNDLFKFCCFFGRQKRKKYFSKFTKIKLLKSYTLFRID